MGIGTYSIGEAAEMVGLSPDTLRSWERRYGLAAPGRTAGNRRRYTLEDVEALIRVKRAASARSLSLRLAVAELELGQLSELVQAGAEPAPAAAPVYEADVWRAAADVVPELILVLDAGGRVLDANMAVARAAGVVRTGLLGLRFTELVDPYDRAKAVAKTLEP